MEITLISEEKKKKEFYTDTGLDARTVGVALFLKYVDRRPFNNDATMTAMDATCGYPNAMKAVDKAVPNASKMLSMFVARSEPRVHALAIALMKPPATTR